MKKKIIITGAGGFIGSELTRKFSENGHEVIAISLEFSSMFPDNSNIRKYNIDINDSDKLTEVLNENNYDAFYHLAWLGVNGPQKANPQIQLDNIKLTLKCAEIAAKIECKKFLCAGTVAERAVESLSNIEHTSGGMMYGVAKYATHLILETYCKNIGLEFVWMQFSNIYGPHNKTGNLVSYTLEELTKGREASFGPGLQPYDFVFVDDLINAVYKLGITKTANNFYVISSGRPRILKDYLIQIGKELEKSNLIKIGSRPDDGIVYSFDMFDNANLVRDIGYYNETDFDKGIKKTIEEYT